MKNAFIFLAGVVAGAVAAYFYTDNKCKKDTESMIEDLRETYNERVDKIEKQYAQIQEMGKQKDAIMEEIEKQDAEKKAEETPVDPKAKLEYTEYSSIYKPDVKAEEPKSPIRIITEAEEENYVNDKGFDMVGLSVYADGVVIDDETEEIVTNYESMLGNGCVDMIFKSYEDGEQLCILNEDRNTVYDITVSEERFGGDNEYSEVK